MNVQHKAATDHVHHHLDWLTQRHSQSAGAARNLRAAANSEDTVIVADQKRKAADGAAINAAHYFEVAQMLKDLCTARQVLRTELMQAVRDHTTLASLVVKENAARKRYTDAIDHILGYCGADDVDVVPAASTHSTPNQSASRKASDR